MNNLKYALVVAPMLAGCPGTPGPGPGPVFPEDGLKIPECSDGQLLISPTRCESPPPAEGPSFPNCKDGQALNGDGKAVTCVDVPSGGTNPLNTKITMLTEQSNTLITRAQNFSGGGGGGAYVGVTAVTGANAGKFVAMGEMDGLNAANKLCDTAHAGSHMCSMLELYNSVVVGKLKEATASIPRSWIFFPTMTERNTNGATANPTDGVVGTADNCGSGTYPTGDRQWFGVTAEWTTLANNARGFKFYYTSCAAQNYPIACCK